MDIINSEKDIIRAILRTLLTEHNDDDIENNTDFFKLLDEVGNDSDENDSRGFISDSDSNDVSNLEKYAFVDETRLPNSRIKFGKQREEVTHGNAISLKVFWVLFKIRNLKSQRWWLLNENILYHLNFSDKNKPHSLMVFTIAGDQLHVDI